MVSSNISFLANLLQECIHSNSLRGAQALHTLILKSGLLFHTFLSNRLLQSYTKAGLPSDAHKLFDEMPIRDFFTWNIMITGTIKAGNTGIARKFFVHGRHHCIMGSFCIVKCTVLDCNVTSLPALTSLVDLYCRCERLDYAGHVFYEMQDKNIVSWNAILTGLSHNSLVEDCLIMFKELLEIDIEPDHITCSFGKFVLWDASS